MTEPRIVSAATSTTCARCSAAPHALRGARLVGSFAASWLLPEIPAKLRAGLIRAAQPALVEDKILLRPNYAARYTDADL
eukprot:10295552-Heterocapsa_arctica.AAC.1